MLTSDPPRVVARCPRCREEVSACGCGFFLQARVRGTREPHKLAQGGSTPPPATPFQAARPPDGPAGGENVASPTAGINGAYDAWAPLFSSRSRAACRL